MPPNGTSTIFYTVSNIKIWPVLAALEKEKRNEELNKIRNACDGLQIDPRPLGCQVVLKIARGLEQLQLPVNVEPIPYVLHYTVDENEHIVTVDHCVGSAKVLHPEPEWGHFVLDIELSDQGFSAEPDRMPDGSYPGGGTSQFPYDDITLEAVLKVLESREECDLENLNEAEIKALQDLHLLSKVGENYRLEPQKKVLETIGKQLFTSLLPGKSKDALKNAFDTNVRIGDKPIAIQLRIPDKAANFGRYPWELLHDGHRHYARQEKVEMTRLIKYREGARKLEVKSPPARLLFISAHPKDLSTISNAELIAVWKALREETTSDWLVFEELDPPTWENLKGRLSRESDPCHIIHFDGHGDFYKQCLECNKWYDLDVDVCENCRRPLAPASAYLAFKDQNGNANFINSGRIEDLILKAKDVQLVFLSACQSSWIQGKSVFSGLGPALIRGGVPAVVAMQFSMPTGDAAKFAEGFYEVLAEKGTLIRAMAQARRKLYDREETRKWYTWYIPTLYLRTEDDDKEGRLFRK